MNKDARNKLCLESIRTGEGRAKIGDAMIIPFRRALQEEFDTEIEWSCSVPYMVVGGNEYEHTSYVSLLHLYGGNTFEKVEGLMLKAKAEIAEKIRQSGLDLSTKKLSLFIFAKDYKDYPISMEIKTIGYLFYLGIEPC